MTREHEYLPAGDGLPDRCKHCGAPKHPTFFYTCLERRSEKKPPRAIPRSGVDDNDAISARLAELRKEREAGLNSPAEPASVVVADEAPDWMCG